MAYLNNQTDGAARTEDNWSAGGGYSYAMPCTAEARRRLDPLLDHIRQYDLLRRKLEEDGGDIRDLGQVAERLSHPLCLKGAFRDSTVALVDQASIRTALYDVGCHDVHVDIRQLATGMPVYYFCRVRHDYWSEYSLIVEDLYRSAGYPMADERFVRLMDGGHETYYLRLSQFRENVKDALSDRSAKSDSSDWDSDDLLHHAGRHVFQAAWHEDQRPGMLTAKHFGLQDFSQAIELLYLCLSGELCELRQAADDRLLAFFEQTYPQPAIRAFLEKLVGLDGAAINDIPRAALAAYARLSGAFSRFLGIEVPWGRDAAPRPLYKLVFANFARLDTVAARLRDNPALQRAAEILNRESRSITADILR